MESILANGLRAGADGFVHLTTDETIALYCVHMHGHKYQRNRPIALFQVNGSKLCVEHCDENSLFAQDCYVYRGDIPNTQVKFMMITQVERRRAQGNLT
jgi:hypothetical protein